MSLLTNEQIEELTLLHDEWWDGNEGFQEYLNEWNEKQTGVQVNVDWGKAPECAERAEVNFYWVGEDTWRFCFQIAKYDRPKPIITPHPHAEMIMKYAEVAQRRDDPWVEFEWTYGVTGSEVWVLCDKAIGFAYGVRYRHIGETK
jgi:hypothetical protein